MTLVIAAIETGHIWMVSDTAITDPKLSLRDRRNLPKVEASVDRRALIGFAGNDADNAAIICARARAEPGGPDGLNFLVDGSRSNSNVEFSYAYYQDNEPCLFRVSNGMSQRMTTFHLGSTPAFEIFQRIRHGELDPYAPKALKTFMTGAKGDATVPEGLSAAIRSMIDLFAARTERDVGGWAVPYLLNPDGAHFCSYGYGVSDPIFDRLVPGSIVPHGTPQEGGANLSVTELSEQDGQVVYWLQQPGGLVLLRSPDGSYHEHSYVGLPTEFKQNVQSALGRSPELWIGDQPAGPIQSLTVIRGADGRTEFVVGNHGNALSFAVHNLATPFHSKASVSFTQPEMSNMARSELDKKIKAELSAEKRSIILTTLTEDSAQVELSSAGLGLLIQRLAFVRAQMNDPVPNTLDAGVQTLVALDPIWRTERPPHPGLEGILVTLRHNGFGWLGFLLPDHEARSMGTWLVDNTKEKKDA
jgi:hypothetical protein